MPALRAAHTPDGRLPASPAVQVAAVEAPAVVGG